MTKEEKRFKTLYNSMLESGELGEVFPLMQGIWLRDKKRFIREQQEMEDLLSITNIDLDDIDQ